MQTSGREPSMEDILASIKKVIAEEKELRTSGDPIDSVKDEPLPEEAAAEDVVPIGLAFIGRPGEAPEIGSRLRSRQRPAEDLIHWQRW